MKKWILLVFLLVYQPAFALISDLQQVEPSKFIELYRKFFEKEIVADLSATRAELNAVLDKRNLILDYMNNNNLKVSDDELLIAWQAYIKKNFKTIDEFGAYLENSFIKEFELKERFKQNLYFSKYFNEIITPRIKTDFDLRKKVIELAELQKIDINENDFKEAFYQMAENWGGYDNFNAFLSKNDISLMEISFYIKAELLKNKILDIYLKNNPELLNSIESSALNENSISNQKNKPLYFFKHAYISKDKTKSFEKINEYHKLIQNSELKKLENSEVIVEDVKFYVDPNSDLIAPEIKKNIIELSNDGLFVSKKISPIVSRENSYHIFQLTQIEIPKSENLSEIRKKKIELAKRNFLDMKNFTNIIIEQKESLGK